MRLYLTRHGQTEWNVEGRVQGRSDVPLTEEGLRQARELAARLAQTQDGPDHVDLVVSSPLSRARVTAEVVCEALCVPLEVAPELTEQSFGAFEGVSNKDPRFQAAKGAFFERFEGGESFLDVAARVYPYLDRLRAAHAREGVLMVTHNGICRVVQSYFRELSNDEFRTAQLGNCEVRRFEC